MNRNSGHSDDENDTLNLNNGGQRRAGGGGGGANQG